MSVDTEFWESLHRVLVGAGAYITDPQGRALLVKPNYRPHWSFAGGAVDEGEHPAQACARELVEELGLALPVGELLVVQWVGPRDGRPYPLINFVFDCGVIDVDAPIKLQAEELDDYGFFTEEEAASLLPPWMHDRVTAAAAARAGGTTRYLPPVSAG
ncbi:NUDIX domain-containing protein [Nonomuraea africana]|uniref:ADP-ribose pyrophosphatase YjhB (NUDIX family) n=1 Tax=Nonomuraea africana TaxID=46171 RepID=A0ABR9KRW1_9ACTN|nr:NUDIX hydrolase [Nonomuraea africana]MBE1564764.1 ADP-ribose pyrophosphatase YjhB (NUDIX family) [Nonomuraea africana]